MGLAERKVAYINEDDYVQGEEFGMLRHEYHDGQVYAMAGASDAHNLICSNVNAVLNINLPDECEVFVADMKIRLQSQRKVIFYYPDVMVSCAAMDRAKYYRTQPRLIVEVLSQSPERQDRGEKFWHYQQIPSLLEYILLAQNVKEATLFRRSTGWQPEVYHDGTLRLDSVGIDVPLDALYRRVRL